MINCKQAKQISIIDFLEKLNHKPKKIRANEYWYKSPVREESIPSFKVNRLKNTWWDYGMNHGGNIIDLAKLVFYDNDLSSVLRKLEMHFSLFGQQRIIEHNIENVNQGNKDVRSSAEVLKIVQLNNPALLDYLAFRKVEVTIARRYCREIYYKVNGKHYFAIGFENNSGGYELRNKYFKNCISPKDVTLIKNGEKILSIFEGFFDFLSYLTINEKSTKQSSYLISNSLGLIEKSLLVIEKYQHVNLYLDNDEAGRKHTALLLSKAKSCRDCSFIYSGFKDFNQWLMETNHHKQREKVITKVHL